MKAMMIQTGGYLLGISMCVLHALLCPQLFGPEATPVIAGVQLLPAAGIVYIRRRAPEDAGPPPVQPKPAPLGPGRLGAMTDLALARFTNRRGMRHKIY